MLNSSVALSLADFHWLDHLLALAFGVVIPLLAAFKTQPAMKSQNFSRQARIATLWTNTLALTVMAGLVLFAWRVGGRSWATLGLEFGTLSQWLESLLISTPFLLLYVHELRRRTRSRPSILEARRKFDRDTPFLPHTWSEFGHALVLCLAAGVGEEIFFRGHLLRYGLAVLGSSTWGVVAAIGLPALFFALAHRYQGTRAMIQIVVLAVCFSIAFLRTGTLWPLIFGHALIDVLGMAMAVWLVKTTPDPQAAIAREEPMLTSASGPLSEIAGEDA